jgi:hypothetical protein
MIGPATIEGAVGQAMSFEGELLVARLSRAFAPGTPVKGTITLPDGDIPIEGRAIGSKRTTDGTFEVRARVINLRRETRERLRKASSGA